MKPRSNDSRRLDVAFTLLELMVVTAVIVIFLVALVPRHMGARNKAERINCVNNLKQVGLSFRLWAGDHGELLPMQIPVTNGGALDPLSANYVASRFTTLSNELGTPKLLLCPADKKRSAATSFGGLANSNVSYFVGLNATKDDPQTWLVGDRNITNGTVLVRRVMTISTNSPIGWTAQLHQQTGNIGLADGSVQQLTNFKLNDSAHSQSNAPLRLAIPE